MGSYRARGRSHVRGSGALLRGGPVLPVSGGPLGGSASGEDAGEWGEARSARWVFEGRSVRDGRARGARLAAVGLKAEPGCAGTAPA